MDPSSLTPERTIRIAKRLARHARRRDALLRRGMVTRLWGLLETAPGAREAYDCPTDRTLAEHGSTLTPDELDDVAKLLATRGYSP